MAARADFAARRDTHSPIAMGRAPPPGLAIVMRRDDVSGSAIGWGNLPLITVLTKACIADYSTVVPPPLIPPPSGTAADYSAIIPPPLISPPCSPAADYSTIIPPPLISPPSGTAADYSAIIPPPLISPPSGAAADYSAIILLPLISPSSGAAADYSAIIPPPLIFPPSGAAVEFSAMIPPPLISPPSAFKGADGKPVVLSDVLLVPDLKANLISLRKLAKCGVSTSTDGAKTFTGQLGKRVLWDLHESRDICESMWQLPVMSWGKEGGSQGKCNAIAAEELKVSARGGEIYWMTAHRRLGRIAMPALQQLQKEEGAKGLKLIGATVSHKCETCMLSKLTRFPFHATEGGGKKLLELVHMDVVGPLPVLGERGEKYFLTIVDDWS
ncbi:unnamed protein product [Closterium sp. NIES-54]